MEKFLTSVMGRKVIQHLQLYSMMYMQKMKKKNCKKGEIWHLQLFSMMATLKICLSYIKVNF